MNETPSDAQGSADTAGKPTHLQDPDEKEIEQKMIKTILGMPKEVQDRFKILHMLSDKRSKLNDEFNEACKKLEMQIAEKKKPLLQRRKEILQGEFDQFEEYIPQFDQSHKNLEQKVAAIVKDEKDEEEDEPKPNEPTDISYLKGQKGVPDFWFRAIKNNRLVWDQVKEKDEEILKCLKHVETEAGENEQTKNMLLTLRMEFEPGNDFFTPEVLTVSLEYESEDQVKIVKGTSIEWLEGKDPTKKKIKKK